MLPPLHRPLLSLPPSLRTSIYRQHQQRSFSASTSRTSPLSDALLSGPTLLLDILHATGLSWHTAIPLSAIIIRTLLVYHLSALPARKAAIIRTNLAPLSTAKFRAEFAAYHRRAVDAQLAAASAGETVKGLPVWLMNVRMKIMKPYMSLRNSHRVGKEFGAPVFSWWRSPVNLGVLIAMTEAVRMKCGAREGLLNFLIRPIDRHVDPETARKAAMTSDEIMVERLEAAQAARQAAQSRPHGTRGEEEMGSSVEGVLRDATSEQHLPALNTNVYAGTLDPTLKTEGMAWFPDLTLADSTLMLPLALSTTMAMTVILRPKTNSAPIQQKKVQKTTITEQDQMMPHDPLNTLAALPPRESILGSLSAGQKFGLSISVVFFFAATKLPAAVLLYLMTSLGFGWLQSRWLDFRYPLPEVVRPCQRPVRVKVRKQFRDA